MSLDPLLDLALHTLRNLRAHALRYGLTSLGLVWGIFTLTFLQATTDGLRAHFERQITKVGARLISIYPGVVERGSVGERDARPVKFRREDLERIERTQLIEAATPDLWAGNLIVRADGRTKLMMVHGVSEDAASVRNFEVAAGRFLEAGDVRAGERVAFLGAVAAERLFPQRPAVGRTVHIDSVPFRVVGVSRPKGEQLVNFGPNDDEQVLVPFNTVQRWFVQDSKQSGQIFAQARSREESAEALQLARSLLGLHHRFRHDSDSALKTFNLEEILEILHRVSSGIDLFFLATSVITLLVGAVAVMNIMIVIVSERTREIGLRKAIGFSNRAICIELLCESTAVSLLAGATGSALACAFIFWLARQVPIDPRTGHALTFYPQLIPARLLLNAGVLSLSALVAGMLPALRAMRVEPASALRDL